MRCLPKRLNALATPSRVTAIQSENGRAARVQLADGNVGVGGTIVSAIDPKSTYALCDPMSLPAEVRWRARHFRTAGTLAKVNLALSTLPFAGLELLADHRIEQVFVVLAALFGFVVIGAGYCRHRLRLVIALYAIGVSALLYGAFGATHGWTHASLLAIGGVLLGSAHAVNRRGVRLHACAKNAWRELADAK